MSQPLLFSIYQKNITSSGSYETPFGFVGEQQDASGLLYLRARYLSTSTGRFTSVDPFSGYLNYPASMNPYQYAYNNPLRYVDPSGKIAFAVALGLSTAGGAAIGAGGSVISQLIANGGNWNCIDWGEVGRAAIVGAIGGAAGFLAFTVIAATGGGLALTLGLTVLLDVGIGEFTYAVDQGLHGEEYEFSWQRVATNAVISAVTFGAGYGFGKIWNNTKEGIIFGIQNKMRKLVRSEEFITNFSKFLNGPVVKFEGRKVFTNPDLFDWDHEISNGITNTTRSARSGLAPLDSEGRYMVLHHIFQKEPGPMVILPDTYHRPNTTDLHGLIPDGSSFRLDLELDKSYRIFKSNFWKWFANNH